MQKIEVIIENTGERLMVDEGTPLSSIAPSNDRHWLGALVNNRAKPMSYTIFRPKKIQFFDIRQKPGWFVYENSVSFLLHKAVRDCFPEARLLVEHTMIVGFFCRIVPDSSESTPLPDQATIVERVRNRMKELQALDIPFVSRTMLREEALKLIEKADLPKTYQLVEHMKRIYVDMQFLDDTLHVTTNILAPSTGCLTTWDFEAYESGFLLRLYQDKPEPINAPKKLFQIFQEHRQWVHLLHVPTITDLNRIVHDKGSNHLIQVSEALHEKKYAEIADAIYQRKDEVKMVLLAGPSSSGKTTSCRRLSVQLSVLGFDVQQISLDDYFVCRARTPRLPNGEYDFENVSAIDIPLLNDHLNRMFKGERVEIPTFDFLKGDPYYSGKAIQMTPSSILLVEGIHALNPMLTEQVDERLKFKVYVNALTQIAIDNQTVIHSSDNRLIRRIVRDNNFRGWDAWNTLHRWEEVRNGELVHIFPFQKHADMIFNSALLYELGVLRTFAEPQLKNVAENVEEFAEAQRLLRLLELVDPIDSKYVPPTSIMREFLGGSSFEY
ncbi:MAG: nucleoside kinase [Bacteroidales bacterium]|nr:nucleoside kinase [Bacteroidales bacterium]